MASKSNPVISRFKRNAIPSSGPISSESSCP